jgi:hypothetical protein
MLFKQKLSENDANKMAFEKGKMRQQTAEKSLLFNQSEAFLLWY